MSPAFPDLFLIGAPKCGTTSLAAWLAAHPGVAMSDPKEPGYYAPDVASSRAATTEAAYLGLFGPSRPGRIRAEASTTYLRSRLAAPAILADNPAARFVVCLRNPVEMAASVHAQLVRAGREPEREFARAWALQMVRDRAPAPRRPDHNPADWQYAKMCRLGAQVADLLSVVPRAQVHFVFLDDLSADPRGVYTRLLAFAGLADDGRRAFPVFNRRRVPRVPALARAGHLAGILRRRVAPGRATGLGAWFDRVTTRPPGPAERTLEPGLARALTETFRADIDVLARLTGRNLDHWRVGAGAR